MAETDHPSNETTPDLPGGKPSFSVSEIFLGDRGLRAGWGMLLFAAIWEALFACVFPLYSTLARVPLGTVVFNRPWPLLVYQGMTLFCIAMAMWAMGRIEGRAVTRFGAGGRRPLRNFVSGLGWGVAMLSLLIVGLHSAGLLASDGRMLSGWTAWRYGAEWAAVFLLVGLAEEFLFRGYLQFTLARGLSAIYRMSGTRHCDSLGFWTAAIVLSFAFGFGHTTNAGESPVGLLGAGAIGIVFCLSLWRTGSLWWAIGFHAAWDWAQSFLYGVADSGAMVQGHFLSTHPVGRAIYSGGLTGPEGSVFVLPVVALTAVVVLLTLPRANVGYLAEEVTPQPLPTGLHLDLP